MAVKPKTTNQPTKSGRLPKRGRKRRERIDESKNVQTYQPAPTASTVGPCVTVSQIVGRPGTGRLPSTIAPPPCGGCPTNLNGEGGSGGAKVLG